MYESKDFGLTLNPLWSGIAFFPLNIQLYADIFDVYIVGLHSIVNTFLSRIDTSPDGAYTILNVEPPTTEGRLEMTHYFNDFGFSQYSVVLEVDGEHNLMATFYPEYPGAWTTFAPVPGSPIDVVFPDMPDSPRFVVGFSGNSPHKVWIISATDEGLTVQYPTNWSAMISGAMVKDLEVVRFI
jgi:hypothetical protein